MTNVNTLLATAILLGEIGLTTCPPLRSREHCAECGCQIPPGKAGRRCVECRQKAEQATAMEQLERRV